MSLNEDRIKYVWTPVVIIGVLLIAISPLILLKSAPRDDSGKIIPILATTETTPSPSPDVIVDSAPVTGIITDKRIDETSNKYYLTIDDRISGEEQTREVSKSVYLTVQVGLMFTITDSA